MARIFISYAREDEELARYITRCLRNGGHEPWLDRENLLAGDHLDEALIAAAKAADCGLFLIGWDWIRSYYTRKEIQLFAMRDQQGLSVRRIGILRARRDGGAFEERIPAEIAPLITEEWIDGVTDPELAVGNLWCAIERRKGLSDAERKARGRELAEGSKAPEAPVPITDPRSREGVELTGLDRPSLFCDRAEEWNSIESTYGQAAHHLLLIAGARGEGHDYFVARIQHHLRKEPPHEPVRVQWPLRPLSRDAYREEIANALECRIHDLAAVLRERMSHRNLILVHPLVDDDYDDDNLVDYYTRWLPELIAEAKPAMRLKSVQPVAWSEADGMRRMFGLRGEDEQEARSLLSKIDAAKAALTTVKIELGRITDQHVDTFCSLHQFSDDERRRLHEQIRRRKRIGSRDILMVIDDFMRRRGEMRV